MKSLILASGSPRRRALLDDLGLSYQVQAPMIDENDVGECPEDIVKTNAKRKCAAVASTAAADTLVIAADTLVFLGNEVLSKPVDLDDARRMLSLLSGKTHEVITGVALCDTATGQEVQGSETTAVSFRLLNEAEIEHFVKAVSPLDRAGAYTVDGPGSLLVSRYEGCYLNVLGLPIVRLDTLMRQLGMTLFDYMNPEKARFL
ncbi:MAG: septum formation protein Maf [Candidatus Hydrogenedentes bacterium]|nr:septum formation protein Maf [Candidatus Hydrogenedentota bacterium]